MLATRSEEKSCEDSMGRETTLPEKGEKNGCEAKSDGGRGKLEAGDVAVVGEFLSLVLLEDKHAGCRIFGLDRFNGCVSSWGIVLIFSRRCFKLLMRQSMVRRKFSSLSLFNCFSSTRESIKLRIMGTLVDDDAGGRAAFDCGAVLRRLREDIV